MTRTARRLAAALLLESRIEWRYRVVAAAAAFAVGWTALLLVVPAPVARALGSFVLLLDTAAFGAFFVGLLVLHERTEGALAALRVTPLRTGEHLAAKLAVLTGLSVLAAVPVAVAAGRPGRLGSVLLGVGLAALLILTASLVLALRQGSMTGYLTSAPLVLLPGLVVPLAYLAGLFDHPLTYLLPTTGAAELIRSGVSGSAGSGSAGSGSSWPLAGWWRAPALAGYALVWIIGLVLLAVRRSTTGAANAPAARHRARSMAAGPWPAGLRLPWPWRAGWLPALVRLDLRLFGADRLLIVLLGAPLLLALALRYGFPPAARIVADRYGVDLAAHQGVLLGLLVLVHVPVIGGMIGSLLLLDDLDERHLLLLRVTPVTLERYLGYRAGSTVGLTLVGLLIAVPVSGLAVVPLRQLLAAVLLAAGQAVLILLVVAGYARNKVHGLALLKLLGGAVLALAALPWLPLPWLQSPAPVSWLSAALPPAAVTLAQQTAEASEAAGGTPLGGVLLTASYAAVGGATTMVGGMVLARRAIARITS
ncbi:hypothetical protein ACN27F_12470 [Solwaraspora sp. WMMB335]|uniref:fluoroquinolone export ABC transporter permease subunit n=1 Tax=Solwaraspora sp. WMMB335 TaxID=3404118 RepID=UPI003B929AFA